jgi:hypothetical protein
MMYIMSLCPGHAWRILMIVAERIDEPIVTASMPVAADISATHCGLSLPL